MRDRKIMDGTNSTGYSLSAVTHSWGADYDYLNDYKK
jgi:hypothetical protein